MMNRVGFVGFIFLLGSWINIWIETKNGTREKRFALDECDLSYYGVVREKFIDKHEHNTAFIVLKSGEKIGGTFGFYNHIQVGDSISKTEGTFFTEVYSYNRGYEFSHLTERLTYSMKEVDCVQKN